MKPTKLETAAPLTLPSPHRMERVVPQSRDRVRGKRALTWDGYFCDMTLEQTITAK